MKKDPQILITNDDGIYAPGIYALAQSLKDIGNITIVAPETEKSAAGHSITISDPIRIQEIELDGELSGYSVKGTPADCVKLAVQSIMSSPPDIVVSGINMGANVGYNIIYSGTVSAATEGTLLGIPSLAISLDSIARGDFSGSKIIAAQITENILENSLPEGTLLNVNVPNISYNNISGFRLTSQGKVGFRDWFERREDPRGRIYYWMSGQIEDRDTDPEVDSVALKDGFISVTPIHYELTNKNFLSELSNWSLFSDRK